MSRQGEPEQLLPLWAASEAGATLVEEAPARAWQRLRWGRWAAAGAAALAATVCLTGGALLQAGARSRGGPPRADASSSIVLDADGYYPSQADDAAENGGAPGTSDGGRSNLAGAEASTQEGTSPERAKEILASIQSGQQPAGAPSQPSGETTGWDPNLEAQAAAAFADGSETAAGAPGAAEAAAAVVPEAPTPAPLATTTTQEATTTPPATTTTREATETTRTTTTEEAATTKATEACGLVEDGIDYPGNDLRVIEKIKSDESCCQECADDVNCVGWVWGKKSAGFSSDMCFLKGGHPRGQITRVANPDVVSGQPTQVGRSIATINRTKGQSLFCFALMMPKSYEVDLLLYQFSGGGGIFGCDEYVIYSNITTEVAPGCSTQAVNIDLHTTMGGEFGTALNNEIFLTIWQSVTGGGRYKFHDWTVKADPDTVFFAPRMRLMVQSHKEADGGVYLNNCKFGLHGPVEVLSSNAVAAWDGVQKKCTDHFWEVCSGDCQWGEDMFMDQCLNYTGVKRENDYNMLLEDHCDPPEGWDECTDPTVVAFHPFKTVEEQQDCEKSAKESGSRRV